MLFLLCQLLKISLHTLKIILLTYFKSNDVFALMALSTVKEPLHSFRVMLNYLLWMSELIWVGA